MNEGRREKITKVANQRQIDLTVILENIIDPHNMSAIVRTCDAVGIPEIYMIYSDEEYKPKKIKVGKVASGGSRKWVDVHMYLDMEKAFDDIKSKYNNILATHLHTTSDSLYSVDLTQSTAWLFGNEKYGLSEKALAYADANIVIPQMGMVNSLNISVACAITLFESLRQRKMAGMYKVNDETQEPYRKLILDEYMARAKDGYKGRAVKRDK